MSGDPVAGVLLAAGTSSRMGRNKLLLELNGETVIHACARQALDGGVSPLIVVLGAHAQDVRRALTDVTCDCVLHAGYAAGIASSMRAGLAALPATVSAAVILLADMPSVTADMVRQIIDRYHATQAPLIISDYAGVSAPPILYHRRLWAELMAIGDRARGREVAERHRSESERMQWPATALADLDVPDDYDRLTNSAGATGR